MQNSVAPDEIQQQLAAGLLAAHAHTSPKYLYDVLGSRLFADPHRSGDFHAA
jgi:uncharacterized SAM-dependent methyltransferase